MMGSDTSNAEPIVDVSFGEMLLRTGPLGMASTEIRVADAGNWYAPTQVFYLTPAKCTGIWQGDSFETRTCDGIRHTFEPPTETVELQHLFDGSAAFNDVTTFAVKGYVIYGESLASASSFRPSYEQSDWDSSTCPTLFGSQCYCPVSDAPVSLLGNAAEAKELMTGEDGFFAETIAMSEDVILSFGGYKGHTFELWNVTGGTFVDDSSSLNFELISVGPAPSVNFTASSDKFFVLVDVTPRSLLVQVHGGDQGLKVSSIACLLLWSDYIDWPFLRPLVHLRPASPR